MDNITPAEKQYLDIKKEYKDCVVLFRMGDFYECFDDDAKLLSRILGLTLTSRSKGENKRPMAGVPYHALDNYLGKIVNAGFKVAIADQLEDAKYAKSIVKRGVTRVVTSGTLIDDRNLSSEQNIFVLSVSRFKLKKQYIFGVSYIDLSTAEFKLTEFVSNTSDIPSQLAEYCKKIQAKELITTESLKHELMGILNIPVKVIDDYHFDFKKSEKVLCNQFRTYNLKGFGVDQYVYGIGSAGALLYYLQSLQQKTFHLSNIVYDDLEGYMNLDYNTIKNLELLYPNSRYADENASLIGVIDKTLTPGGKRLIRNWIIKPLINLDEINKRLKHVETIKQESINIVRNELEEINDIERIAGKIGTRSVSPKDFISLKQTVEKVINISKIILDLNLKDEFPFKQLLDSVDNLKIMNGNITETINDDAPFDINQGNVIKDGLNSEIDEYRKIKNEVSKWMADYQLKEIELTGISTLKVRFNNVFGYYIEISKGMSDKAPDRYIRKQTLVNAERYVTQELKEMETKILNADEKLIELEKYEFEKFIDSMTKYLPTLLRVAYSISYLDVITNFAYISMEYGYTKPEVDNNPNLELNIINGRHPVIERITSEFIPNDISLSNDKRIIILTGPNMSGKSTYIRQIALIVLLAQIGCFVPAESARISILDRIFTRIGASDNLSKGESTFMVEMNETANILNNATYRSLLILDEVGRGTSTFDGVAIAWSVVRYINDNIKARTLFATHYNELTKLEERYKEVMNFNVEVLEKNNEVIFLHKIIKGAALKSFGVHVARIAGLPNEVIKNADKILKEFEESKGKKLKNKISKNREVETPQIELGL